MPITFVFKHTDLQALIDTAGKESDIAVALVKPKGEDEMYAAAFLPSAPETLMAKQIGCPYPPLWPQGGGGTENITVEKEMLVNAPSFKVKIKELQEALEQNELGKGKGEVQQLILTLDGQPTKGSDPNGPEKLEISFKPTASDMNGKAIAKKPVYS
jgi:hypothetical protein